MYAGAKIRASLDHPIIDCDSHILEFQPLIFDFLQQVSGAKVVGKYIAALRDHIGPYYFNCNSDQRRLIGAPRGSWWPVPAKLTDDRATAVLPKLMKERLDSFGIDLSVVYPTFAMMFAQEEDAELRQGLCRACNVMQAELFNGTTDRLIPVATIPMHSPEEAVNELRYAVLNLGYKAVMISGMIRRPLSMSKLDATAKRRFTHTLDLLAIDSLLNYDEVWQACLDLRVIPAVHSSMMGDGAFNSPTNYIFNHIGMFSAAHHAFAKALILGGVTHRFPDLRFVFLEGGVNWAVELCNGLIGHWEKRNREAIDNYNPAKVDIDRLIELVRHYGGTLFGRSETQLRKNWERFLDLEARRCEILDEFALGKIESQHDLTRPFINNFYLGCEGDDRAAGLAFEERYIPAGCKLNPVFGSDIGHWDVSDMSTVLCEAFEQVEEERMSLSQFREFSFLNAHSMYTGANPKFFSGTVIQP